MDNETNIPRRHRMENEEPKDIMFKVRNVLNIVFMVGAIVGVAIYCLHNHDTGIMVVLSSMVFKIAECCLRFFHK